MGYGRKNTRYWLGALCIGAIVALPVAAQQGDAVPPSAPPPVAPLVPFNNIGIYDVSWSGVPVGNLVMEAKENASAYEIHVITQATGAIKLVTKHKSNMDTSGSKSGGEYIPKRFDTTFRLRGDTRVISLDFDGKGKLVGESNEPPEPETKRPKVPSELKVDLVDPMTLFYAHRPLIQAGLLDPAKKDFTLRYYDGRRLTDLHYTVEGYRQTEIRKKQVPVYKVSVTRQAIAGYKDKELKEMEDKDLRLQLFLSTDGKMMPLKFIVDAKMGAYYATYRQDCVTLAECQKLIK